MSRRLEDYGLIGDTHTAALVARDGSIDWFCAPRFDSGACFSALLGGPGEGHWRIAPKGTHSSTRRRYRGETLILENEWDSSGGRVRLTDFMPIRDESPHIVRVVEGLRGRVTMNVRLVLRFDYGRTVPWVRRVKGRWIGVAGPNGIALDTPVALEGHGLCTEAQFVIEKGERVPFVLSWFPSHLPAPEPPDWQKALANTEKWWTEWSNRGTYKGPYREAVIRALITLKAMTYAPTGGIIAAPTTSLPEQIGGVRNWDYRYCWLRDATLTLYSLIQGGYRQEAGGWTDWLLRSVAGDPMQLQILYGLAGERLIPEIVLDWLPGYEGSKPVRIGNAAISQLQLDVFGEVMDTLYVARKSGLEPEAAAWNLQMHLLSRLEQIWQEPDDGLWEVRGGPRKFTHSRVMAWVAVDRAIKSAEEFGLEGPVEHWKHVRRQIHDDVTSNGFDEGLNSFVQSYGSKLLDASLLQIPLVGFLPPDDPRVQGTIRAIEKKLMRGGYVMRYEPGGGSDNIPGDEGAFLPCSFWLADAYAQQGRHDEARALYGRLLELRNDLGLLSEEYDPKRKRMIGNFPQAFTLIGVVNGASNLTIGGTTAHRTGNEQGPTEGGGGGTQPKPTPARKATAPVKE